MSIENREMQIKEEPLDLEEVPCIQFDVKIKQEDEVLVHCQEYNSDSLEIKQECSNGDPFTETFVATEECSGLTCRDLKDKLRARLGAILKKTNLSNLQLNQLQNENGVLIPKCYHKLKEFHCEQCTFTTMWKTSLRTHIRGRHSGHRYREKFKCPECDFVTIWKSNLISHAKGCHGLEAFSCHHCSSSMKWKRYLGKSNLASVKCDPPGFIEYKCHNCHFTTRMRGKLIKHVKGCHEFEKFNCDRCDFVTRWKANLTNHFRVCHISGELKCTECAFTTKWQSTLIKHIKGRHSA
ncbi:hypothetical protein PPYR_13789 [Photinus pyralis]|uniref:Protein hunchback n=2 Tax=Photinus pyralis TaxID=7054 RepID=A0A5N4AA55_PHOPY|nr:hypothetical protein PPYR_13789 [Photinus pyralis]